MMINVKIGDIFKTEKTVIVNPINCVGVMGKGLAKIFKDKYPDMASDYFDKCKKGQVQIGKPYLYESVSIFKKQAILNFPTKEHWRSMSQLSFINDGIDFLIEHYKEWGISSIAIPPLGCGNGGLDWKDVGRLLYKKLRNLDLDVELYAPFGTPKKLLEADYLQTEETFLEDKNLSKNSIFNPNHTIILECLYILQSDKLCLKVGRTIFQKLAYVITKIGIPTNLNFKQASYGPFSEDLHELIRFLSNNGLIVEEKLGTMINIKVTKDYTDFRNKYLGIIAKYNSKIQKTTDLFKRIKSTAQAEEVTTIFYTIETLKKDKKRISDLDILDYMLDWKKRWNNPQKIESLVITIRNLSILKWIDIDFSDNLNHIDII